MAFRSDKLTTKWLDIHHLFDVQDSDHFGAASDDGSNSSLHALHGDSGDKSAIAQLDPNSVGKLSELARREVHGEELRKENKV